MKKTTTVLIMAILIGILLTACGGGGGSTSGGSSNTTTYTVTYNGNGSTGGSAPVDSTSYTQGQIISVLANTGILIKIGYSFSGWNTKADGSGTTYTQGQTVTMGTANITLYAKWTSNPTFTVTYNGNGSTAGSVPVDSTNYVQGQTVTVLANTGALVKTNYSFSGWNTVSNGTGTTYTQGQAFTMGTANVTLYAQWTTNPTYAVTYNGNGSTGGSVPVDSTNYEQGQIVTVLANTGNITRTNYSFSGWNTQANGSGTTYTQGQTFTMGSVNVTLYAKWTATYSISGTVTSSGTGTSGITMTLTSASTATITITTDASGNYTFTGLVNGSYTVTPSKIGYTFSPTSSAQTVNNADIAEINFSATAATSDDSAIRAVFATMKTAMEAHNLNDIMALFDTNYFNNGTDRATQQSYLADGVPTVNTFEYTISSITITANSATVNASVTVTFNNGQPPITFNEPPLTTDASDSGLGMGYFTINNGQWMIYGNQIRADAYINTGHNATPGDDHYFLRIRTTSSQPISAVTCSGPNIPVTSLTPDPEYGGYKALITPSSVPPVGSVYTFTISFSDGTEQILQNTIKAYVSTSPEISSVVTGQGTATFNWTDLSQSVPNADHYWLQIQRAIDNVFWEMNDIPMAKTSVVFNENGTASDVLKSGQTYIIFLSVFNTNGDYAYQFTSFTMP